MNRDNSLWENGFENSQEDFDHQSRVGTVNYRGWLVSVFCWDGILPAGVLGIPQMALSFGADRSLVELFSITMPILAFFIRIPFGFWRIGTSHCGPILRCCQFVVFFLAAVFLVCLDTMTILAIEMNNGRLWANQADFVAVILLWSVYFLAMLFVLYPGRSPEPDSAMIDAETTASLY